MSNSNMTGGKNNKRIFITIVAFVILGIVAFCGSKFFGGGEQSTDTGSYESVSEYSDSTDSEYSDSSDVAITDSVISDNTGDDTNDSTVATDDSTPAVTTDTEETTTTETTTETATETTTETITETTTETTTDTSTDTSAAATQTTDYYFRSDKLLTQHYEKHGIEMGFASKEDYQAAASAVINNPEALTKTESEDGDYVYYVESTNEFVILSQDGYIRTYFYPSSGKAYYDRQ